MSGIIFRRTPYSFECGVFLWVSGKAAITGSDTAFDLLSLSGVCAVNSSRLNFGARGYVKADAHSVGCALVYLYAVFQPAGKDVESAGFWGHFNFGCCE